MGANYLVHRVEYAVVAAIPTGRESYDWNGSVDARSIAREKDVRAAGRGAATSMVIIVVHFDADQANWRAPSKYMDGWYGALIMIR